MPLYRFHIFDEDHTIDGEGQDLANLDAARTNAIQGARGMMADELRTRGRIDLTHWIEIEDEEGEMTVMTFGDAIKITP